MFAFRRTLRSVSRPIPCEFCGTPLARNAKAAERSRRCTSCDTLARPFLVQENPRDGAREVMISQHSGEPRRKLLELRTHSVVVFLDDAGGILALEIETKSGDRVLRWHREKGEVEYLVHSTGRSYSSCDEMIPRLGFDRDALRRDLDASRTNLRPFILYAFAAALNE